MLPRNNRSCEQPLELIETTPDEGKSELRNEKDNRRSLPFFALLRALLRLHGAGATQSARPLSELRENRQETGQAKAGQARLEGQDGIDAQ
jgi:hypothetical protein